jgi:hypothetical protein
MKISVIYSILGASRGNNAAFPFFLPLNLTVGPIDNLESLQPTNIYKELVCAGCHSRLEIH